MIRPINELDHAQHKDAGARRQRGVRSEMEGSELTEDSPSLLEEVDIPRENWEMIKNARPLQHCSKSRQRGRNILGTSCAERSEYKHVIGQSVGEKVEAFRV